MQLDEFAGVGLNYIAHSIDALGANQK